MVACTTFPDIETGISALEQLFDRREALGKAIETTGGGWAQAFAPHRGVTEELVKKAE